jgi:Flp pilus assembly protein TadD
LAVPPIDRTQLSSRARTIAIAALTIATAVTLFAWWRTGHDPTPAGATVPAPAAASHQGNEGAVAAVPKGEVRPPTPVFELPSRVEPVPGASDSADVLRSFQDTILKEPENLPALYGAGRTLLNLGRAQEAIGPLAQAMANRPDNWSYAVTYGYAAARAEQWADALRGLRIAQALRSDDATTYFDLGLVMHKAGDREGAVREYRTAIGLDGGFAPAWCGLAISLDWLGRTEEAIEAYNTWLRLAPEAATAGQVRARRDQLSTGPQ